MIYFYGGEPEPDLINDECSECEGDCNKCNFNAEMKADMKELFGF